ncbi:MAG: YfdX family protein [Myxococcales bacterium]|nr:YfdX family protein [Myxococcales bacterium]
MILALMVSISFSGLPAQLESKARTAIADVAKAKSALSAGNSTSSQSWLAKAEGLLSSVLGQVPGGDLLKKGDKAGSGQPGAVSQAESEVAKVDPSLAGKLGIAKQKAAQGDTNGASSAVADAKGDAAQKTGLGELADIYQKVTSAQTLLKAGENSKAKNLLDEIPLR